MSDRTPDEATEGSSTSTTVSEPRARRTEPGARRWRRAGSGVLGAALVALGLRRRSLAGAALAAVGGWLSYRAVRGRNRRSRAPGSARTAGSAPAADRERRESAVPEEPLSVSRSVTVGKPADELTAFVRDAENLDRAVGRFAEVAPAGEDRHRWTVRDPLGRERSRETRIVEDDSGERVRWEPIEETLLVDAWSVSFRPAPGDRGTEVTLDLDLVPPGGPLGAAAVERLQLVPDALVSETLHRLKSLAETGELPTLSRNPSGRGSGDLV